VPFFSRGRAARRLSIMSSNSPESGKTRPLRSVIREQSGFGYAGMPICLPTIVYSDLFFWDSGPLGPATLTGLRGSPSTILALLYIT
jgi:hypothetical protein